MRRSLCTLTPFAVVALTIATSLEAGPLSPRDWVPVGSPVLQEQPIQTELGSLPPGIRPAWKSQAIVSVTPSHGTPTDDIVIRGRRPFGSVTEVRFGSSPASFIRTQPDGSLVVRPGSNVPGSTVSVSVSEGILTWTRSAAFTYPIANMWVTGPLPYSATAWDSDWYNGRGHGFNVDAPAILSATAPPVLHVTTEFIDDTLANPYSNEAPFDVGNFGDFTAQVQYCEIAFPFPVAPFSPPASDCTNWDGNPGTWKALPGIAKGRVTSPGPNREGYGDLALPTAALFDERNLVRTLRLDLHLEQGDTRTSVAGSRADTLATRPFTVVVEPSALIQVKLVPYTIVYQPPGNASNGSYQTTTSYNISYKLGDSKTQSNVSKEQQSTSEQFSVGFALTNPSASASTSYTLGESWDTTVVRNFGTAQSGSTTSTAALSIQVQFPVSPMVDTIPGNADTCASAADCSQLKHAPDPVAVEPFWGDTFVFQVHPQFAAWVLPAGGVRYAMIGAVPVTVEATVAQLMACWQGVDEWPGINACDLTYTHDVATAGPGGVVYRGQTDTVTLTPDEAGHFLELDPFVRGQAQPVAARRAIPVASYAYGKKFGDAARPVSTTLTSTQATTQDATSSTTTTLSVTSARTTNDQLDIKETLFSLLNIGGNNKSSETDTTQNDLSTTFTQSTAVTSTLATQAAVTLNDLDTTQPGASCGTHCHLPLPNRPGVNIYLDKIFGGFMFQDPTGQINLVTPSRRYIGARMLNILASDARVGRMFSDVPPGTDDAEAVGVLVRTHVLAGVDPAHFAPSAAMSRIELAAALDTVVRSRATAAQEVPYGDLPRNTPVAQLASRVAAARLVQPRSATLFGPYDHVTRGEVMAALVAAFPDRATTLQSAGATPAANEEPMSRAEAAKALYATLASGVRAQAGTTGARN